MFPAYFLATVKVSRPPYETLLAQHRVLIEITEEGYDTEKGALFVSNHGSDHRLEQLAEKIAREFSKMLDGLDLASREVSHRPDVSPATPTAVPELCRNARVWVLQSELAPASCPQ